ncbi:MAG TPA: UDP-3-O-(3-hydroxymyristoyl)glucosamine N-acyltransferase [Pyrinomonadaceae bacterium]|jgi:UDP-3-O-[3-hydroxymyristoyl] glucosamine N-acyltransferase|nr:UDP-3-O-(3-hydroxymyristoyl)glucosamine N-acyltransferase [Pyrinomonadaceae bacterium]
MNGNSKTVAELAAHVGGRVIGDESILIGGVASIDEAADGEIAFIEDAKLLESAQTSKAACLIVPRGARVEGRCLIEASRPKLAFALIAQLLYARKQSAPSIHPTAIIAASAEVDATAHVGAYVRIGEGTIIGAGAQVHAGTSIGEGVNVGRDCVLYPNVVLYDDVTLGERVILHAGVCIGADGFGYVPDEQNFRHKFPQLGSVHIEDDVEIGANSCVDRGALGRTRIGRATKIDNLVQIAHNVDIGERVVIAAQTGISGSTVIEDDAVIGGQVGMGDHARVQSGAIIGSKAGILPGKIVRAGVWWGIPVQPLEDYKRLNAHMNRLPQMREELKKLRAELEELKARMKAEG